ncbi:hypothetical protein FRC10_003443 [Ceratobasidium sp. 414]|nr:hypothetical protein FRC10_003443 [Ceratobasidium sp. 414]
MDVHEAPIATEWRWSPEVGTDSPQNGADETAMKFPEVDVTSIDAVPTIPYIPRANLQHEVYEIHEGIMEADETFDAVHASLSMA